MPYPITIGATENGQALFGKDVCRQYAVIEDQVFGSQLAHRVVVRWDNGQVWICTPTEARKSGWTSGTSRS